MDNDLEPIRDLQGLRQVLGEPRPLTYFKIHQKLNAKAQDFIRHSPLLMLSTANCKGESTVSPKGDLPGFVIIGDERTIFIPERTGNKLIFSFQNILENSNVGLLFMVPGTHETLRIRGRAELAAEPGLCQKMASRGKPALMVMVVKITEAYFHCAKAFLRSSVWQPESWPEKIKISFGEEISCNSDLSEGEIRKLDAGVDERYKTDL